MSMGDRTSQSSTLKMLENRLEELSGRLGFYFSVVDMEQLYQRFDSSQNEHWKVLSDQESDYYDNLRLGKHKVQWLSGRYAVKAALLKYKLEHNLLLDFHCIDVLKGRDSAPYILQYPWMACSISHSSPYCMGVVSEKKIGVDIERVFHPEAALIRCFYSEGEKDALAACGSEEEYAAKAMIFWTRKEAVSKLLGLGMKMNFRELDTVQNQLSYAPDCSEEIRLHSFVCRDFCVSLAIGG